LKWIVVSAWLSAMLFFQYRGAVRAPWKKVFFDHSALLAPLNALMVLFSRSPRTPFVSLNHFPELKPIMENWRVFQSEAMQLMEAKRISAATGHNDIGFNSFFKFGWKRFYLKWYEVEPDSAALLCPKSVAILKSVPSVKAAMFAELPPGGRLNAHRDPYAGSLRFHMGLMTPNSDDCWIRVDGQTYSWRDGQATIFDETYIHEARNDSSQTRVILFCDVERPIWFWPVANLNRLFGRWVMSAASSPNQADDQTGWINKIAHLQYKVEEFRKAFKGKSLTLYKLTKAFLLGLLFIILIFV
jgi:beta-hydroxylase